MNAGRDLSLRPARPDEIAFFFSTRRAAFRQYVEPVLGWDDDQQRAIADREFAELPVQVIVCGEVAVGYLCVVHAPDHDYLDEIALLSEWQGQGIGASLVRRAMGDASRRGVPLRLSVFSNNPAQRLYTRLGFRVTSVDQPRIKMEWRPRV